MNVKPSETDGESVKSSPITQVKNKIISAGGEGGWSVGEEKECSLICYFSSPFSHSHKVQHFQPEIPARDDVRQKQSLWTS